MDRLEAALSEAARKRVKRGLNLALFAVIAVLVTDESKILIAWHFAMQSAREHPGVAVVPQPLSVTTVAASTPTTTITRSGCSIDVPWTDIVRKLPGLLLFKGGPEVVFFDPSQEADTTALRDKLQKSLGENTIRSNYDIMAAEMAETPADVKLVAPLQRMARTTVLLMLKGILVGTKAVPIYSVQMGRVRGFQVGDPRAHPDDVQLRMFDQKDRPFHVMLAAGKESTSELTQTEINGIVRSMRCEDTPSEGMPTVSRSSPPPLGMTPGTRTYR